MRTTATTVLATSLLAATALAQGGWLKQTPSTSPPARAMAGLAAMTQQNVCVLFGGEIAENAASLNDTWTWDGTGWTQLAVGGPVPLEGFVMEYDSSRDRVVLFSGWNGNNYPTQTWEFDGATWTLMATAVSPPGRDWSAGAFDPVRGNLVIFGGHDWSVSGGVLADTWTYDGTTWTSHVVSGPTARMGHAMAFDPVRQTTILFGGTGVGTDMWEWNGTAWTQLLPTTVPPARQWHQMVTDPVRNRVVMLGGLWAGASVDDVWEWDGADWTQVTTIGTHPSGSFLQSATFDPVSGKLLHFGGSTIPNPARTASSDETKLYVPDATGWAVELEYGTGCGAEAEYASYYEQFGATAFDLGGSMGAEYVATNTFIGTGYLVLPGATAWYTPLSGDLGLGDDTVSPAQPLGFTLNLPNGLQTTDVYVCSNGYIWLTAAGGASWTPSVTEFLTQGARLAPYWTDLKPAMGGGAGTIHFDTDPTNGMAYVTYLGVAEYSGGGVIDMQVAFSATGNIEFRYGAETMSSTGTQAALVGLTPGNGAFDPGSTDISNIATMPIITTLDVFRLDLALSTSRPIIGSTMHITTDQIPSGSLIGALVFGLVKYDPGVALDPIGMTGCFQYCSQDGVLPIIAPSSPSTTTPFTLPPIPNLVGIYYKVQGAVLDPAGNHNALGALSSNGVELKLDLN